MTYYQALDQMDNREIIEKYFRQSQPISRKDDIDDYDHITRPGRFESYGSYNLGLPVYMRPISNYEGVFERSADPPL